MIIGVICTVIFGIVAIWQTFVARSLIRSHTAAVKKWQAHLRDHMEFADVMRRRFEVIRKALPLHFAAAFQNDARLCNAILAAAIEQANTIKVEEKQDGSAP